MHIVDAQMHPEYALAENAAQSGSRSRQVHDMCGEVPIAHSWFLFCQVCIPVTLTMRVPPVRVVAFLNILLLETLSCLRTELCLMMGLTWGAMISRLILIPAIT